uniref:Uncharacterized protein n=1 Tax=Oryza sativa subsp. japonica TaxID=39947 RepID=Q69J05_ORYSJ|nr:hypothetical protein [Oryza sativa Japonica Group]BAD34397.1 hypothetical protein [Oryza sativa Japonica Group]
MPGSAWLGSALQPSCTLGSARLVVWLEPARAGSYTDSKVRSNRREGGGLTTGSVVVTPAVGGQFDRRLQDFVAYFV